MNDLDLARKTKDSIDDFIESMGSDWRGQKYVSLKAASNALTKILCPHPNWKHVWNKTWKCTECKETQWRA